MNDTVISESEAKGLVNQMLIRGDKANTKLVRKLRWYRTPAFDKRVARRKTQFIKKMMLPVTLGAFAFPHREEHVVMFKSGPQAALYVLEFSDGYFTDLKPLAMRLSQHWMVRVIQYLKERDLSRVPYTLGAMVMGILNDFDPTGLSEGENFEVNVMDEDGNFLWRYCGTKSEDTLVLTTFIARESMKDSKVKAIENEAA